MPRDSVITPAIFDEILAWLHPNRDEAGRIYVQLRDDLTRIFEWNRCMDPEGLTDEVFDRVARKVLEVRPTFSGNPKLYFYGVARNLVRESPRRTRRQVALEDAKLSVPEPSQRDAAGNVREECLESCLQQLSDEKKALILGYYANEKQAKIDHRAELAKQHGITVEALRVRVHRLRGTIEKCVEKCVAQQQREEMKRIEAKVILRERERLEDDP